MKECSGMCDSFMLMNSVSSEFWRTNYFYHAVCNINFVLIQEHGIPFLCPCFLIQTIGMTDFKLRVINQAYNFNNILK